MTELPDPLQAYRLDGEVALVTGGGNGIGRETARVLAAVGARVVLADIDPAAAEEAAGEIAAAGGAAQALALDVTDEAAVDAAFAGVADRLGRLDMLVNNAGLAIRAPALELALEDWNTVNRVNVTGVFLCARAAARHMLPAGGGRIVNMASIMGFSGGGFYPNPAYQASKGAVVNLTRALAVEWAPQGIRVNAVAPTWVRTRLIEPLLADERVASEIKRLTPMGRVAEPVEVAQAVLYLLSPAASMVTGHSLAVDGGYLAQ